MSFTFSVLPFFSMQELSWNDNSEFAVCGSLFSQSLLLHRILKLDALVKPNMKTCGTAYISTQEMMERQKERMGK